MLENVAGRVEFDPAVVQSTPTELVRPKAPGMKYRHYAPEGKLTIFEGEISKVAAVINDEAEKKLAEGYRVGIIATDETQALYRTAYVRTIGSRGDEASIAAGLYKVLRELDEAHIEYIYSESFEDNSLGQAINEQIALRRPDIV